MMWVTHWGCKNKLRKFKYLSNVISDNGRCETEIGMVTDIFPKLSKTIKHREITLERKKIFLNCYMISTVPYDVKPGQFHHQKKKLK